MLRSPTSGGIECEALVKVTLDDICQISLTVMRHITP